MNPEWHDFIQRHMAGTMSDEEELVLQMGMKTSAQLRALYLDYMNLDVSLEAAAGAAEMTRLTRDPAPEPAKAHVIPSWRALAALSIVILLAAAWVLHLASSPKVSVPRSIAAVKDARGANGGFRSLSLIPHGLHPGSVAYADRPHVWESSEGRSFPASLMNADVVRTPQFERATPDALLEITLARPAQLFILMPRREPPPAWLAASFTRTGEAVELLEVKSPNRSRQSFDVWKRTVAQAGVVTLGPASRFTDGRAVVMYGIAAKAL
jgi:hypothetical protein